MRGEGFRFGWAGLRELENEFSLASSCSEIQEDRCVFAAKGFNRVHVELIYKSFKNQETQASVNNSTSS